MGSLRICSWNINGLRSFHKPLKLVFHELDADIICLQETKSCRSLKSCWACVDGYNAYFSHCTNKPGYSGVAIFCRDPVKPVVVTTSIRQTVSYLNGFDPYTNDVFHATSWISAKTAIPDTNVKTIDAEGRFICAFFPSSSLDIAPNGLSPQQPFALISVYVPRLDEDNPSRTIFRSHFEVLLGTCLRSLAQSNYVIVAGDFNVHHSCIDHCDPKLIDMSQVSILSRRWFNALLLPEQQDSNLNVQDVVDQSIRFVDVFRHVHPRRVGAFTCWSLRTSARQTNYGVRLDYILVDARLFAQFTSTDIRADHLTHIFGSDHCPVWASFPLVPGDFSSYAVPVLCSSFWPQCLGKQLGIDSFIVSDASVVLQQAIVYSGTSDARSRPVCQSQLAKQSRWKQCKLNIMKTDEKCHSVTADPAHLLKKNHSESANQSEDATDKTKVSVEQWRRVFPGLKKKPRCRGHNELCVLRTVRQDSTSHNRGRRFWVCARPQGARNNPNARCNTFIWDDKYTPMSL